MVDTRLCITIYPPVKHGKQVFEFFSMDGYINHQPVNPSESKVYQKDNTRTTVSRDSRTHSNLSKLFNINRITFPARFHMSLSPNHSTICDQTPTKIIEERSTVTRETTAHPVSLDQLHTTLSSDACLLYPRLPAEN
jgi:hypothetical protein